jgi:glutathione S-transferase
MLSDVKVFALSASVLYVKFLASTMIQGRKAFAANTRMPEDKVIVCNMGIKLDADDKAIKRAVEDEMRWKRIIQNDLESMPLAFVVFWAAISVGVSPAITKTLMTAYTSARVGHTAVYSLGMPRARMACWMAGVFCVVATAANAAAVALT